MIEECTVFGRFMDSGDSRPFLGRNASGNEWVIKFHNNELGAKILLNELVAGRLAEFIRLPWPPVSLVSLSDHVIRCIELEGQDIPPDGLRVESKTAVGSQYIKGLRSVPWPEGGPGPDLPRLNAEHLVRLIPVATKRDALYGKMVFDNWITLHDTKYDTLFLDENSNPLFLDASHAFFGLWWDEDLILWKDERLNVQSPYLEGILTEHERFYPWLARVASLQKSDIREMLRDVPAEWDVPPEYLKCMEDLFSRSHEFVGMFARWMSWEYEL